MGFDWALLEAAAAGELSPTLRFYSWSPSAVSLGRFQDLSGIDTEALLRRGWDLVRRPTGGRAVLHHLELTYSLVLPPSIVGDAGVRTSYAALVAPLNAGLRSLIPGGAPQVDTPACEAAHSREPNCFALASECDTLVAGSKLVGSAQVRHRGALLQHGSILLDADRSAWAQILGSTGRLTTLTDLLGRTPGPEQVEHALMQSFQRSGIAIRESATPAVVPDEDAFRLEPAPRTNR